jgi:hypothetical protein
VRIKGYINLLYLILPRYAIGDSMDLSSAQTHVSKLTQDTNGNTRISSIISVKSTAAPVKRKAVAMEEDNAGDKNKKTRRGGGKKMKK